MGHVRYGFFQQRRMYGNQVGLFQLRVPGQRADVQQALRQGNAAEFVQIVDVDKQVRRGQAHVQGGIQALPAGKDFGGTGVLLKQVKGVVNRPRPDVVESCGFHFMPRVFSNFSGDRFKPVPYRFRVSIQALSSIALHTFPASLSQMASAFFIIIPAPYLPRRPVMEDSELQ